MMKKRRKGFTLIEMLVTLTVFSLSMVTIVNLLTGSLKIMERITGGDNSKTSAVLLIKVLDNTFKNAYNITSETNQTYIIELFDQKTLKLVQKDKMFYLADYQQGKMINTRVFQIDSAKSFQSSILETGGRKGFKLTIEFPNGTINRVFILGYKKKT
ncbi:MAG: hypothetical protein A2Y33_05545 [Spirochaetes bacterium GWF1_51_8]|nr:MAG: hypothetical protein A2Y33_05545 [Spirochaetes bacterium GWF1_51_8]